MKKASQILRQLREEFEAKINSIDDRISEAVHVRECRIDIDQLDTDIDERFLLSSISVSS